MMAKAPATRTAKVVGLLDNVGRVQLVWSFIALALPFVGATAAVVTGFLEREAVMWIITAAFLTAFAGIAGFNHLMAVRLLLTTMNKLRYANTFVGCDLVEIRPGKTKAINQAVVQHRHIDKMQVGVYIQNMAHFDISAYVESANTAVEGNTPPRGVHPKAPVLIGPGQTVFMADDPIDMKNYPCKNLAGQLEMTIKYGAPGREKYDLAFRGRLEVHMRQTGVVTGYFTIWDNEVGVTSTH
jgi:hypothetical protein